MEQPLLRAPRQGRYLPVVLASLAAVVVCTLLVGGMPARHQELEQIYVLPRMSLSDASAPVLANSNLMEEGSIKLDPSSSNPSADFYDNAMDAGDDEDVEDAGPGGILPGWTQPELLNKPDPLDLQSFQAPSGQGPVFNPVDYSRNPGAIAAVNAARDTITEIKDSIAKIHTEAEMAEAKFQTENAKASAEEKKYAQYVQKMNTVKAANSMWAPNTAEIQQQQAQKQKANSASQMQGDNLVIDPSQTADPAAEYRKQMYSKAEEKAKLLQDQARIQKDQGKLMSDEAKMVQPQQLRIISSTKPTYTAQPQHMSDARRAAAALREMEEKADLARDVTRMRIAQSKLAAAMRKSAPFRGGEWREGCPAGTPGCTTNSPLGYLEHSNRGVVEKLSSMKTAGDRSVPVDIARNQIPTLI